VHVDAAGHDDKTSGVERPIGTDVRIRGRIDDFPVANPDIAALAVDAVERIVDGPARDLKYPLLIVDVAVSLSFLTAAASAKAVQLRHSSLNRGQHIEVARMRRGKRRTQNKSARRPCGRPCPVC
jgi:hypothetical protein